MIFRNSREPERSFMSRPNWQTPWHRRWVHGDLHEMRCKCSRCRRAA